MYIYINVTIAPPPNPRVLFTGCVMILKSLETWTFPPPKRSNCSNLSWEIPIPVTLRKIHDFTQPNPKQNPRPLHTKSFQNLYIYIYSLRKRTMQNLWFLLLQFSQVDQKSRVSIKSTALLVDQIFR